MDDRIDDQTFLDATGLLCPLPVLKARKRLAQIPSGHVLRVWADDPAASIDFPHFCAQAGHELASIENIDAQIVEFRIVKFGGEIA